MNSNITVRNGEVSQETKEYIQDKIQKLGKYSVRRVETIAEFEGTKDVQSQYKIEIVASPERGGTVVGTARASEWFGAVDQALDKAERQLRKAKEKSKSHRVKRYTPEPQDDGDDDMIMHY
ncbi:ribosome hibernation-promoting factor, HPF/YfiA family [Candidatus Uabimicrobium sp. HlEnr_7]|uniref:ribosome hibernation-promoting factor, HPF/YfiA family n=1 Tax=Candidatus Uabimicrobium helgolandensis TaxID=3095367 RepID=UPI003557C099